MVFVRKRRAGSDSLGHVWVHDGDTVDMPYEQAVALTAIRDAGFEIVEPEQAEPDAETGSFSTPRGRRKASDRTEIAESA